MSGKPDLEKIKKIYIKVSTYNQLLEKKICLLDEIKKYEQLPIISKKEIIGKQSMNIMPEFYTLYLSDKLKKARTSGSSGQYLEIYWDNIGYLRSMIELWLLRAKFYEIYPHNRLCFFFTESEYNKFFIQNKNEFGICKVLLSNKSLVEVYEKILEWDPEWMILQPSTAVILCNYVKSNKLDIPKSLRYIEFTGEVLTMDVENMTKSTFGCKIANQYGCNEVNSIAYECPYGKMHILNSNVFVEIVDESDNMITDSSQMSKTDEREGRIIITSKQNRVMPFIRYDIGDRGKICSNKECQCGGKGKIIELATGRKNDYVMFPDGEYSTSYIFVRIFDMVNNITDGAIIQFYVEQNAYDEFDITICKDDDVDEKSIIENFYLCIENEYLYNSKFKFQFCENLFEVRGNGKYMYFKNNIQNEWG